MDRLFSVFLLLALLAYAPVCMDGEPIEACAQPVFFSMLFPQLMPEDMTEECRNETAMCHEAACEETGAKVVML